MTVATDETAVRQFIEIISAHAVGLAQGNGKPGVLQLSILSPVDEKLVPNRFRLDDVDAMVGVAVSAASTGQNVYIEGRTVRADLRGNKRGGLADTQFSFGTVVDADHDKGKGGNVTVRPSLAVETSPGNFHYWYLFYKSVEADEARRIGEAIRANSGTDQDTGVVTQCYRVAGTPNYPSKAKQARGRVSVEPTRIVEWTGRLWDPKELEQAFAAQTATASRPHTGSAAGSSTMGAVADEANLPDELMADIRKGGVSKGLGAKGDKSRSGLFHHVIGELKKRHWSIEQIHALLERYPNGVAAKYPGRLREEIKRSYARVENGNGTGNGASTGAGGPTNAPAPGPQPGGLPTASAQPQGPGCPQGPGGGSSASQGSGATPSSGPASTHILPTIRLRDGQLVDAVEATESAMIAASLEVYVRASALVYPVGERAFPAAGGRETTMVCLDEYSVDSLLEEVARAAIFQRYNVRKQAWTDVDPPLQLVRVILARRRKWTFPRVAGVIATPTLRPDGSLLDTPGYDPQTELYLWPGLTLSSIPTAPTKGEALAALSLLKELFDEFSFRRRKPAIDLSVALAGVLTALLRGSLPTAPVILVRGDTPGVGKSYLVDVIATVATGQLCPAIVASRNVEEAEKRIGSMLLDGCSIVSLDNLTHNLDSEILCQVAERPVVKIRVLGLSKTPSCECHTAIFATGNNVNFKGDMVRRGLLIDLEALSARPELQVFKGDALAKARAERAKYVAAALTIARAYFAAGKPKVCGPFGSYGPWSDMVRSPLVWLGEPDPMLSVEEIRKEDEVLASIVEFFGLWLSYLKVDHPYTTARIIETAETDARQTNNFNTPDLKLFLLKVAASRTKSNEISSDRLGKWLHKISGRPVEMPGTNPLVQHRLVRGQDRTHVATFCLTIG